MISYELAKELKEAEFPQGDYSSWYTYADSMEGLYRDSVALHMQGKVFRVPTLEELIEACGEEFEGVRKVSIEFDHTHYWLSESDSKRGIASKGLSPTEAVAHLYIALHK